MISEICLKKQRKIISNSAIKQNEIMEWNEMDEQKKNWLNQ